MTTTTTQNPTTLPAALASIRATVNETRADLQAATESVRAFLGLPPAAPVETTPATSLPEMLASLTTALTETVDAFRQVRGTVHALTHGTIPPATPTPVPVNGQERKPEAIPQPLVAPTLAGGLLQPSTIATPIEVPTETLATTPERPVETPESTPTPDPIRPVEVPLPATVDELPATTATENHHTENGRELATVGTGIEEPTSGKRGGRKTSTRNRKRT